MSTNQQRQERTYAPLQLLDPAFLGEEVAEANSGGGTVTTMSLEVLSLVDQLYHPPKTGAELAEVVKDFKIAEEIDDVDDFLASLIEVEKEGDTEEETDFESIQQQHRELILDRIRKIMAYSGVQDLLDREIAGESKHFERHKKTLERLRDLKYAISRGSREMRRNYFRSKRRHGHLTASSAKRISHISSIVGKAKVELESSRVNPSISSGPGQGLVIAQELLRYKRQIEEKGFAITPSRQLLIDRIAEYAMAGQKVFLVGSTGTGKTELAFYVANELTGGYEMIPWHDGTVYRDVMGQMALKPGENGGVESIFKPGPLPRAMSAGFAAIHEEFTGGSTRTHLGMKPFMNLKPGDTFKMPETNGMVHQVDEKFFELFTGNLRDERTKDREELDPAILRMMKGLAVNYMPADEMAKVAIANLMDINGVTRLSYKELRLVIKLAKAAEIMQFCHDGTLDEETRQIIKDGTGIDDIRLVKNFLDTGTFFSLFARYEFERCKGKTFYQYLQEQLQAFVEDPKNADAPEEKRLIIAILALADVIKRDSTVDNVMVKRNVNAKSYTLPSQLGVVFAEKEFDDGDPFAAQKAAEEERRAEELEEAERAAAAAEAEAASVAAAIAQSANNANMVRDREARLREDLRDVRALEAAAKAAAPKAGSRARQNLAEIGDIFGVTPPEDKDNERLETFKGVSPEKIKAQLKNDYEVQKATYFQRHEQAIEEKGLNTGATLYGFTIMRDAEIGDELYIYDVGNGAIHQIPTWEQIEARLTPEVISVLQRGKLSEPTLILVPTVIKIEELAAFLGIKDIIWDGEILWRSLKRFKKLTNETAKNRTEKELIDAGIIKDGWEILIIDGTQTPPMSEDNVARTSLSGLQSSGHDVLSLEAAMVAGELLGKTKRQVLSNTVLIGGSPKRKMLGVTFKDDGSVKLSALEDYDKFQDMWELMTPVISL